MNVLLADDERTIALTLRDDLEDEGHAVTLAASGTEAMEFIQQRRFDCVVTDMKMPGPDGMAILREVKRTSPDTEVIIITGYGTIESAVEAMKLGAFEYILKPFYNEEIVLLLRRVASVIALREDNVRLLEQLGRAHRFDNIIGRSDAMKRVFGLVKTVAPSDSNVLIVGPSGTGKELVAAALHHNSPRKDSNLVKLSCAAIPENLLEDELFGHERGAFTDAKDRKVGRFERADGGTIFLDDIDDMPLATQVKLLRVLQERELERLGGEKTIPIDVRVVAATNRDLETEVREGRFRQDLLFRINVFTVSVAPLRERPEDVAALIPVMVRRYADELGVPPPRLSREAHDLLMAYRYPGNIRELQNVVNRAVVLGSGDVLVERDLPESVRRAGDPTATGSGAGDDGLPQPEAGRTLPELIEQIERKALIRALREHGGVRARAARALGLPERVLRYKLKTYGIDPTKLS